MLNTVGSIERVFLSLGSNMGDRARCIHRAFSELQKYARIIRISSLYETEPVGFAHQRWFLNAAVEIETKLAPQEFLAAIQRIEQNLGRVRGRRFGARTIDLDILLYGARIIKTQTLSIPHIEMHKRAFVLVPLAEIAPEAAHPVLKKTVQKLYRELPHHHEKILLYEQHPSAALSRR